MNGKIDQFGITVINRITELSIRIDSENVEFNTSNEVSLRYHGINHNLSS